MNKPFQIVINLIGYALLIIILCFIFSGTDYRLTFATYTIITWVGVASWVKIMHIAIQEGMLFGKWQTQLRKFDEKGLTVLYKWLGGCEICTSSFFSFLSIAVYLQLMYKLDLWIITGWVTSVLWIVCYWSIGTVLNLYFMTKLFEKK